MKYRKLGKANLNVSEIGFGSWQIGGEWGKPDDEESIRAIHLAIEQGVNFIDTALVYGEGHSERVISRAVAGRREKFVIASKVPTKTYKWPALPNQLAKDVFPADWVIECTEKSLKNLNTDYLDLQQLHAWTPPFLQQTEWLDGFNKLKKQGKIKSFGVSSNDWDSYGPTDLIKSGLIDSVQVIYNIFEQRPAEQLLPAALANKVGIIARVPFEEGLLTGKMGPEVKIDPADWRSNWLTVERRREAAPRVEALKQFLAPDRPTLAALALKFCLSHPAVSAVIPGMRKTTHVKPNCAASDGNLLPPDIQEKMRAHAFVHGWAYPWANFG
ncbi:MAG: aldo/keto reductase [Planctomycetota bacterium]|nr:aldo/keto reductase [Planctomycetota bacterium]